MKYVRFTEQEQRFYINLSSRNVVYKHFIGKRAYECTHDCKYCATGHIPNRRIQYTVYDENKDVFLLEISPKEERQMFASFGTLITEEDKKRYVFLAKVRKQDKNRVVKFAPSIKNKEKMWVTE